MGVNRPAQRLQAGLAMHAMHPLVIRNEPFTNDHVAPAESIAPRDCSMRPESLSHRTSPFSSTFWNPKIASAKRIQPLRATCKRALSTLKQRPQGALAL